ncbi:hypothetical protein K469DRAFT_286385 [Zopfia rhizophila CBS 207.26]|uniref:Zn(2)-C6 fungal-type domain-containing protein n=1 Tax=Zopfia rhizophila CBS 207.26 TaxID=1314779 RepID=A0A6A6ER76_9PEZI|nr:hypothetical protein K469DRAFT_286385 [Zopfia rhizophila CBS 207.26]
MLSAPPRRGNCRSCRERKVDCDRKKPRCSECISIDKPCGGYEMGPVFINITSSGPPPMWNRSHNAQKYLVLDLESQPSSSIQQPHLPQLPPTSLPAVPYESALSIPPTLPKIIDSSAESVSEMTRVFLDLYYKGPPDIHKPVPDPLQPGTEVGCWRALLPLWIGKSQILDTAIGALAACFVGSQHQDESLVALSRSMYLDALRMVQKELAEPNATRRNDLLAATLVMSSTEMFMSNGGGASQLTHIDGGTKLLSEGFKELVFEELHIYILNQGLFEAISSRRAYRFSEPSYRPDIRRLYSIPRTHRNEHYFKWCEIILPLPNMLHAADEIDRAATSSTPTPSAVILSHLDALTALERDLHPWEESIRTDFPGPWVYTHAQSGPEVVPFPLQFVSIEVCTLYNLHWVSQLLIHSTRHQFLSHLPLSRITEMLEMPEVSPFPSSSAQPDQVSEFASLICRSVQFCTSMASFASVENMFLPLYVTASYYTKIGDEGRARWCVAAFARIAAEQRIGFGGEKLDLAQGKVKQGGSLLGV